MYFNSLKKKLQQVNLIKNLRRLPLPRKKKTGHPSWNAYSAMKLNLETIKEEIAAFTAYCAQLCFTLLTWQVVLTGRIAYVGLPSNDDRRTYLDRYMDEHNIGPSSFSYQLPVIGQLAKEHVLAVQKLGNLLMVFHLRRTNAQCLDFLPGVAPNPRGSNPPQRSLEVNTMEIEEK